MISRQQNLETKKIEVSILIISYNVQKFLIQCIQSILLYTNTKIKYEIIVIDNNSKDNTKREIKKRYPLINFIQNEKNIGFTKAMNQAINESNGQYILQLNPDTELTEDSISRLHSFLSSHNKPAILGPRIIDKYGKIQPSHWSNPTLFSTVLNLSGFQSIINQFRKVENFTQPQKVDSISGAAMFYQASTIKKLGLFNENLFWDEDIDFCLRAEKKDYDIIFFPKTRLIHRKGESAKNNQKVAISNQVLSKIKFFQTHHSLTSQRIILVFCIFIIPIKILLLLLMIPFKYESFKKAQAYFFTWKLLIKKDFSVQL